MSSSSTATTMDISTDATAPATVIVEKKVRGRKPAAKAPISVDGIAVKVRRARKHKKDPNAPKRSQTAYLLFSNKVRSSIKTEYPDLDFGSVAKKISSCWKSMSTDDKKVYDEQAAVDKASWQAAQKVYVEAHRTPKKNCTAFIIYSNKFRDQVKAMHPNIPFGHVAKHISVMWKALDEEQRKPFESEAVTDKARYDAEMVEHRLTHPVQPKPIVAKKTRATSASKSTKKATANATASSSTKSTTGEKKVRSTKASKAVVDAAVPVTVAAPVAEKTTKSRKSNKSEATKPIVEKVVTKASKATKEPSDKKSTKASKAAPTKAPSDKAKNETSKNTVKASRGRPATATVAAPAEKKVKKASKARPSTAAVAEVAAQ